MVEEFDLHAGRRYPEVRFPNKSTYGQISAMADTSTFSFAVPAPCYWEGAKLFSGIVCDMETVELEPGKTLTGRIYDAATANQLTVLN